MTPKSDETFPSGTLSPPELNPLLNPILNQNLGRWAEVYFTNPPERRDEAVLSLIRELEKAELNAERKPLRPATKPSSSKKSRDSAAICPACGFDNEVRQKFCGNCGAPLHAAPPSAATPLPPAEPARADRSEPARSAPKQQDPQPSHSRPPQFEAPQFGSILHLSEPAPSVADANFPDRSVLLGLSQASMQEPERSTLKPLYRVMIGTALALLIGGLAYAAWQNQPNRGRSLFPAQAPPAETQPVNVPANASSSSPTSPSQATPPSISSAQASTPPAAAAPATTSPTTTQPANTQNEKPEKLAKPVPASSTELAAAPGNASPSSGNGSQELATALTFLSGQSHDGAQAAPWLWKAVEKKNTAADILLAQLYLRGDGVQKNCDQGRILLDAAADKGNKEAAGLLRNLQAFGCE